MMEITSASNSKYKLIKSLHQKKNRTKTRLFLAEGIKSVCDAVKAGMEIELALVSDDYMGTFSDIEDRKCFKLPRSLFDQACGTVTPQGILAAVKMPSNQIEMDLSKIYIYCDHVSDPGNLGTIIRTADAAGAGAVLLSDGCADVYAPKTVRATMGSVFHVPILEEVHTHLLKDYQKQGFDIVSGALSEGTIAYTRCDMTRPIILVVGNEANGVSEEVLALSNQFVKIPIIGEAESLNVAVAASILLYEAHRQRQDRLSI
jgi:TrmH family RNA methyltransferase